MKAKIKRERSAALDEMAIRARQNGPQSRNHMQAILRIEAHEMNAVIVRLRRDNRAAAVKRGSDCMMYLCGCYMANGDNYESRIN